MSTDTNNNCVTTLRGAWHLRPTATISDAGSHAYPGGERVELLAPAPRMVRGAQEKAFSVRVIADGQTGFAFIPLSDVPQACQDGSLALSGGSILESIFPPNNSIVKAVGGSGHAAIATAAIAVAVGYYFIKNPSEPTVIKVPRYSLASNPHKPKRNKRR